MVKVRNKSDVRQAVSGLPAFEAGEEREVEVGIGDLLIRNPYFELVEKKFRGVEVEDEGMKGIEEEEEKSKKKAK